jgi:hypothetical protein
MLMMGQLKNRMPMTIKNIQISLRTRIPSLGEFPHLRDDDRTDVPDHNSTILTQIIVKKHIARTGPPLVKRAEESLRGENRKPDRKIGEPVEKHGYRQSEIARRPGLFTSRVSNRVRDRG